MFPLTAPTHPRTCRPHSAPTAPRYSAWGGWEPDHPIEEADDLDRLLAVLRARVEPDFAEDVSVFENNRRLIAVVLPDGKVIDYRKGRL